MALTLATGVAIGILIPLLRTPSDTSPAVGFARDMSSHHAQAVEMSMLAVQRSTSPQLRSLALDMGLTQQAQIGIMRAWLQQWNVSPTSTAPRMAWVKADTGMDHNADGDASAAPSETLMPGMARAEDIDRLRAAAGAGFDVLFCDLMIRHHAGGIAMVDAILRTDPPAPVGDLAAGMKSSQQSEVAALSQLRERARSGA